jgi:hypothetical protein
MRKILMIMLLFSALASTSYAQTFEEWFRQKQTQKKYLMQQIAALQVYIEFLQKGYSIAKDGLTFISDIKNGEFNLHQTYFSSLKNINPRIRNYARVKDIISLQILIVKHYRKYYEQARESGAFDADEIKYIYQVYERLLKDCHHTLAQLITVTTDAELEMKDDERLRCIDDLYNQMQSQYAFLKSFGNQTQMLAQIRKKEALEVETSRMLYGLKTNDYE